MSIYYNPNKRSFKLDTPNTSYIMQVVQGDFLAHLYYGDKIDSDEIDYILKDIARPFSPNPVEVGEDRSFSLDTLPLEYPCFGIGDFRTSCFCVQLEDGSTATDLRYISYRIYDGKSKLRGLPATYGTKEECMTLEILMEDYHSKVQVKLKYTTFNHYDVIARSCEVINTKSQPIQIKRVLSTCIDFPTDEYELVHLYGRWASERNIEKTSLIQGKQVIESIRGASSVQHNPFIALMEPLTDENRGGCYGFSFVYSGNFTCEVEVNHTKTTRVVMGINATDFTWKLGENESFIAPEVIMTYSIHGLNGMSQILHKLYKNHLCRGTWKNKRRPILINNWEATYFQFDKEKLLSIAKEAANLGMELFVLDDGWFGERDDDTTGLGDWTVNEQKIEGGLKNLVREINNLGLKFGIWFEPEMISEKSRLYKKHPEWCLHIEGRNRTRSRSQLVLDFSRSDVQDYLFDCIDKIISENHIEYIKWDMNRNITEANSALLPANRQREVWHRYVLGVYSLLERILNKYPSLLIEGCSGGGGRFDAGMLYYTPQIWCSDNTDPVERIKIQRGTSLAYPISSIVAHVSASPNHQTGRKTDLETRGMVAMAGELGYQLNLKKLSFEEKEKIKEQIRVYKKYYKLIHEGDFYRIPDFSILSNGCGWYFMSQDKTEILLQYVQVNSVPNPPLKNIKIFGINKTKKYKDMQTGQVYSGSVLENVGIRLPVIYGDAKGYMCYLVDVERCTN